jgi:RNA polymerase sigma factor (sigma-70 family)
MTRTEFETLVRKLSRNLYGIAYRILREREASEDAVQEVFMKLWKMKSDLGEYRSLEALAVTMIRNQCIDQHRRNRFTDNSGNLQLIRDYDGSDPSPQQQLEFNETLAVLDRIIEEMPEIYRQVIKLRDLEDFSYEEISAKTGQNINTLRVNLSRARKIVREKYKNYYNESRGSTTTA